MALTGASSNQLAQVRRLAATLSALLHRRPRAQPVRQRQIQRRLPPDQVEQLVAEYQAGDDMHELADRWGLHRTTVAGHLRRAGVALRRRGIPTERRVAVGTALTGGPPHRSQRAELPHWAPASGSGSEAHFREGMLHAGGW